VISTAPRRSGDQTTLPKRHQVGLLLLVIAAWLLSLFPANMSEMPTILAPTPQEAVVPPTAKANLVNPQTLPAQTPSYPLPVELQGKPEIIAARSAHSATFDLGDGLRAALVELEPLHYQDEQGAWLPIDPSFTPVEGGWINRSNLLQTSLAERSSNAKLSTNKVGVGWQTEALQLAGIDDRSEAIATPLTEDLATPGTRSADGRTVRYSRSWSNAAVQDQWQSGSGRAEYTMRLETLPQARGLYPLALDLRAYLRLKPGTAIYAGDEPIELPLETQDELHFVGVNSESILLQPPHTYEQHSPLTRVAGTYLLRATADPSVVELIVRTPWSWLVAKERRFPVVIDPIFQTREAVVRKTALYRRSSGSFLKLDDTLTFHKMDPSGTLLALGQFGFGVARPLIKFELPYLPAGTKISQATLIAVPDRTEKHYVPFDDLASAFDVRTLVPVNPGSTLANIQGDEVYVIGLGNEDWLDGKEPLATNLALGPETMTVLRTESVGARWDITTLATQWQRGQNYGVMLQTDDEICLPSDSCGNFLFPNSSTWSEGALAFSQRQSEELNRPAPSLFDKSGIRLMVFYRGSELSEGQFIRSFPPTSDPNYYQTGTIDQSSNAHAGHDYVVSPLPARWQALAVRGLGYSIGPPPDTFTSKGDTYTEPLKSALPIALRSSDDKRTLSKPKINTEGSLSWITFNGRQDAGSSYRLRVESSTEGTQPDFYEVRLISETATISNVSPLPGVDLTKALVETQTFSMVTGVPVALWNLQLPPGSNSRVGIDVTQRDGEHDLEHQVRAQLIDGLNNSLVANMTPTSGGTYFLSGPIFPVPTNGGGYGLVLSYSGPRRVSIPVGPGPRALSPRQVDDPTLIFPPQPAPGPLPGKLGGETFFDITIRISSCAEGRFPTAAGNCEVVECPSLEAFPTDIQDPKFDNYREDIGYGLWSTAGWTTNANSTFSTSSPSAEFIGAGNRASPTVAVVGGRVAIDSEGVKILPDTDTVPGVSAKVPELLLVQCGPPDAVSSEKPSTFFHTFSAPMEATPTLDEPRVFRPIPDALISPIAYVDPWTGTQDASDLTNLNLFLDPTNGRAGGTADLKRELSNADTGSANIQTFSVKWSLDVGGWPSLRDDGVRRTSLSNPRVASLDLDFGMQFALDFDVERQRFVALRAKAATVTQDKRLGGASESVVALLSPHGNSFPDLQQLCASSCVDLRAPDDTFERPNRNWRMPDVHTNTQAGTVLFSEQGRLLAYSSDHPKATAANELQYSFDATDASVSITREPCDEGGPDVTVVKGKTKIGLPNIGDSADADGLIEASFKLCETKLRAVRLQFSSPVGIPVASTGLFVTLISGEVNIEPEYTQIKFKLDVQAAQGGDGGIIKASGEVLIDTRGLFQFQGQAKILGQIGAEGKLWVAWRPLDIGIDQQLSFPVKDPWITGRILAHMWTGQGWQNRYKWLPDNDDTHITAEISAEFKIKEGQIFSWWFIDIPPSDIKLKVLVAFGEFCTNDRCTAYEWGIKGKIEILGYDIGLYYGFDHGFDFILGNDDHLLIDQYGGAQAAPAIARSSATSLEIPVSQAAPQAVAGMALIPITVTERAENLLFGIGWQAGAPRLSLIDPDGIEIVAENAAQHSAQISTTANSALIGLREPKPGTWQVKISNLSEARIEHYKFFYFANRGTPVKQGERLFLTPDGDVDAPGRYVISWRVPADAPSASTINLFAYRTVALTETTSRQQIVPIVKNLPLSVGRYEWDTSGFGNGSYQLRAEIDDGINILDRRLISNPDDTCNAARGVLPPASSFDSQRFPGVSVFTATGSIRLNDTVAPAPPSGLTLGAASHTLLAQWGLGSELDIASYLVEWGPRSGDSFVVENQELIAADESPALRISGLKNGLVYGVRVIAIDVNDNRSTPTALVFATPDTAVDALPPAPSDVTITSMLSSSVSFAWTPPNPVPVRYRITITQNSSGIEIDRETANPQVTVDKLQPGTTYTVRVRSINAIGWTGSATEPLSVTLTSGSDANGDGLPDDWASSYKVSGSSNDADGDGMTNVDELRAGTNPTLQDSDDDELSDFEEVRAGSNALDPTSYGTELLQPRLEMSDDRLVFRLKLQTDEPVASQQISWRNIGAGNLQLQLNASRRWLKATVVSDTIQVHVDPNLLEPGFATGVVRVQPASGSDPIIGKPTCIRVETWASPPDSGYIYRHHLPVSIMTPPVRPDLVGSLSISPDRRSFAAGEPVQITAVITNQGNAAAEPFWADLYIDPSTPPTTANVRWNTVCALRPCLGIAWAIPDTLQPGQVITLTSTVNNYSAQYSRWRGWFAQGTTNLYLYVDSWNPTNPLGAVVEDDETNNSFVLSGLQVRGRNPREFPSLYTDAVPLRTILGAR
jgi:hypothetical protein